MFFNQTFKVCLDVYSSGTFLIFFLMIDKHFAIKFGQKSHNKVTGNVKISNIPEKCRYFPFFRFSSSLIAEIQNALNILFLIGSS